jgi:DNA topoisomerase I
MSFIITESPAKAKKIQGFLGQGYTVKSSVGHIRGLDTKWANTDVKIDRNLEVPYIILKDKHEVVKSLKNSSKGLNVILAADDDREGEAIAWHCGQILNVDFNKLNRIKYREISKKAIQNALKNPTRVDMNEVNAQQARAVIDLLVGYKLSPCLWENIKTDQKGLSAGRVQSALLNLLIQHENKINEFESEYSFDIQGDFKDLEKSEFIFSRQPDDLDEDYIKQLFKKFHQDRLFKVDKNIVSEEKSYPEKPFITSSLQQTAQNTLGFNVKKTMGIAQKLYENGKITYMRTDCTYITPEFSESINTFVTEKYGSEYYSLPKVKKVKGAQEAHEAIRPTNITTKLNDNYEPDDIKLYNLIVKRTIQSHMKPGIYIVNTINLINLNTNDIGYFLSKQKEIKFKGYLIYNESNSEDENKIIPFKNEYLLEECICTDKCSNPPQPYNEAQIVKLLENTGIGRPSTYSTIISTLYNRKYTEVKNIKLDDKTEDVIHLSKKGKISDKQKIVKGALLKNKIVVTDLGKIVLEYLQKQFSNIIHQDFTVQVEKDLDKISQGNLVWQDVVKKVYDSFIEIVIKELKNKVSSGKSNNILIGEIKGKEVYVGEGRYGPFILYDKKFTSIGKYLTQNSIDLKDIKIEDYQKIIEYSKNSNSNSKSSSSNILIGKIKGKEVYKGEGKYGPFILYDKKFKSIKDYLKNNNKKLENINLEDVKKNIII